MAPALTAGAALAALRAFPVGTLGDLLGDASPLVLAPHPDDESLGCGGLLALAAAAGLDPAVLVLTDGAGSHPGSRLYPPERLRQVRAAEARAAAAALGVRRIEFLGLPDTLVPTGGPAADEAAAAVAAALRRLGCGALFAAWRHDPHADHAAGHGIAAGAAAATGVPHWAYPVWGWTLDPATPLPGPAPAGLRLDVRAKLDAKRRAIAAHRSQFAGLIDDDPGGFQLEPGFVARFEGPFETFVREGA